MTHVSTPIPTAEPRRRPGPSLKLSLGMIIVAVVAGVGFGVWAFRSFSGAFTSPVRTTPSEFTITAKKGTYAVYERTGTRNTAGNVTFSRSEGTVLGPRNVTVTGPAGPVPTRGPGNVNETITRGSAEYTASVRFDTAEAGRYTVRVSGPATQVVVARTLADAFEAAALAIVGVAVCGLLLLLGIVLLIVGAVRRKRADAVPVPAYAGYGGGYPPTAGGGPYAAPGGVAPSPSPYGTPGGPAPYGTPGPAPTPSSGAPDPTPSPTPEPTGFAAPGPVGAPAPAPSSAPGWYPDPWDARSWRYHDGQAWTGHTSPRQS